MAKGQAGRGPRLGVRRLAAAALVAGAVMLLGACAAPVGKGDAGAPATRAIRMSAVEYKGSTSVEKEPFPGAAVPSGGGYILKPPTAGEWQTSTYRFEPGLIVVNQGDAVELQIWGVNGAKHETEIEGYGKRFVVKRGQLTSVTFTADKAGIFRIICHDHLPAMEAQLLVLPRG